jgi:hypothetical protein
MKAAIYARYSGIALILAAALVLLALVGWWLKSGVWVALLLVDAVNLLSTKVTSTATILLSDFDALYYVFAEAPLYALLLAFGAVLAITGYIISQNERGRK